MSSLRLFLSSLQSYSAIDLMFGVLICLHVDFMAFGLFGCGCRCMLGSLVLAACWVLWQLAQGKKMSSLVFFLIKSLRLTLQPI